MGRKPLNAYTKSINFDDSGDFYIHLHQSNIGRANNGSSLSGQNIAQIFSHQKVQAGEAAKTYYEELFFKNLDLTPEGYGLLNSAFQEDPEQFIGEIDKQVKENLIKAMNNQELEQLMQIQRSSASLAKSLLNEDTRIALNAFDNLIENLAKASELINDGDLGSQLAAFLRHKTKKNNGTMYGMGIDLQRALAAFEAANPIASVKSQKIAMVLNSMETFAQDLITGKTAGQRNTEVSKKNITSIVDSMFNPGFAEVIASQIKGTAEMAIYDSLVSLTGSETYQIQMTDENGHILDGNFSGTKSAGKADIKLENVAVSLQSSDITSEGQEITMNIGISNKFYRSSFFPGLDPVGSKALSFGAGSGGTLSEAIASIFPKAFNRYLAYNTLVHGENMSEASAALNDLILTRQINRIFATRGGVQDFAQFIFVNGEIISVWDLIQYATSNFLGKSRSQITNNDNQAIAISINKRPEIQSAKRIKQAAARTHTANSTINSATVTAHVHVDKLIQAFQK